MNRITISWHMNEIARNSKSNCLFGSCGGTTVTLLSNQINGFSSYFTNKNIGNSSNIILTLTSKSRLNTKIIIKNYKQLPSRKAYVIQWSKIKYAIQQADSKNSCGNRKGFSRFTSSIYFRISQRFKNTFSCKQL